EAGKNPQAGFAGLAIGTAGAATVVGGVTTLARSGVILDEIAGGNVAVALAHSGAFAGGALIYGAVPALAAGALAGGIAGGLL
ncbi:MAG: hypothetical protein JWN41_212, partial [Thermoleophilia bacterium]|nr:hypothetical protein [Thermoleophilia bacterium]